MKLHRMLPPIYRLALGAIALAMLTSTPVNAQLRLRNRAGVPTFVNGELIVVVQPGTQPQDIQALATKYGIISTQNLGFPQIYKFVLPAANQTVAGTVNAVAAMKAEPSIQYVGPNAIPGMKQAPVAKPNDPHYTNGDQWAIDLIRLPQAWFLQKGSPLVNLADIDDGFAPAHEDMKGRYVTGSMNFDATPPDTNIVGSDFHGAHTSSIMVANTNNGIGMAGTCWQNVNCLALKFNTEAATLLAYAYLLADKKGPNKYQIGAVNMSYGFNRDASNTSDPQYIAIKQLDDAGIICVGAGAEGADPAAPQAGNVPNVYPFVINVVAGTRTGGVSDFNRFQADSFGHVPRVDLVAPGGAGDGTQNDVLGVNDNVNAYTFEPGTSFAAPYVTGVAGLVLSQTGVTKAAAVNALLKGANHSAIATVPDAQFGFGYLDAYGSISLVSTQVVITGPNGVNGTGQSSDPSNVVPPPVETFKPTISFHINNVPCDNVTFTIDSSIPSLAKTFTLAQLISGSLPPGVSDFAISGACTGVSNPVYDVSFRLLLPTTGFFQHTIVVTGTDPNTGLSRTDTRIFTVSPHVIQPGLSMVSIPYFEAPKDAPAPFTGTFRDVPQLLGTAPTLYRYLLPAELATQTGATVGAYAKFSATDPKANVNASFHPVDDQPTLTTPITGSNGLPLDTRPVGVGYFIDTAVAIPVITFGTAFTSSSFKIPLHEGWNLIGDPYPYAVPFNATEIETASGTRVPVAQAVDQNLILPHIYRFVNGDYQFSTLPDGFLHAWEGHWVFVPAKDSAHLNPAAVLNLIVTPTPVAGPLSRAVVRPSVATVTRAVGSGSWKLQLQAHVGDKTDANNFVGMSGSATDGNDRTKVPKPPKPDSAVSLAIVRPNSPATAYAQDLRSLGGSKQWNIVVSTDRPNANVTMEWPNMRSLPKTYSLILTDQVSGSSLDLRNSSSYQFNSGATPGTRSFSLVARPTAGVAGHPVFSNITVNPGRAGGRAQNVYNITYNLSTPSNVSVSILTPGGHPVAQIVTRAVTAGDNSVNWNGLDNAGRPVAAGSYVLQFQAATNDGQTTRVIRPLILSGR